MVTKSSGELVLESFIKGVPIVKTGSYKASKGEDVKFTKKDLQAFAEAFNQGVQIPLKFGHTSPEFNKKVAEALNVPVEILLGEGSSNKGAAKLGHVVGLSANGKLTADIKLANDKVGDLFKSGYFDGFSIEFSQEFEQGDKEFALAITGLAALGAQEPAIYDNPKLQADMLLSAGEKFDYVVLQEYKPGSSEIVDVNVVKHEMVEISMQHMADKYTEGDLDQLIKLVHDKGFEEAVNLAKECSDNPEVLVGYIMSKENATDTVETKPNEEMSQFVSQLGTVLKLEGENIDGEAIITRIGELMNVTSKEVTKLEQYDSEIKELKGQLKFLEYKELTAKFTAIPGTPEDMAKKLVKLEISGGKDTAKILLESYEQQQKAAEDLALTKAKLTPKDANEAINAKEYQFEKNVKAFQESKKIDTYEVALAQYSQQHPKEFGEYRAEKNADNLVGV